MVWGYGCQLACLVAGLAFGPWGWVTWLIYPLQILRLLVRNCWAASQRALLAVFQVWLDSLRGLGKLGSYVIACSAAKQPSSSTSDRVMRIAYLINQYPKVSHSFIRREILALERLGFEIIRIALRGWTGEVVDEEDSLNGNVLAMSFVMVPRDWCLR